MGRAFAEIAFTHSVKAAQSQYGSRRLNERLESTPDRQDELTPGEREFIESRDSFYQATVSETGWPYVQFRGGPIGFLKVLDSRTLGFADFRGNVQYLSVGNINADPRISLILMDYPHRRRLKILGRARVAHPTTEPELLERLQIRDYKARVERAIVISIEAFDWNCPQHITPRFTEAEVEAAMAPILREFEELRAKVNANPSPSGPP